METRKGSTSRSSSLPIDYLRLVGEVFNTNFDEGLKALSARTGNAAWFEASGQVDPAEVVLCVSVFQKNQLSATSVYASCDFDPKASSPTLEDILKSCVDSIGILYEQLLDPKQPEQLDRLAEDTLSVLEDVPFDWTVVKTERRQVYLKIDKANPHLDQMTDEWLAKNDPDHKKHLEQEEKETEDLFFTAERAKKAVNDSGHGTGGGTLQ